MFCRLWVSKVKLTTLKLATLMYNKLNMDVPFLLYAVFFTGQQSLQVQDVVNTAMVVNRDADLLRTTTPLPFEPELPTLSHTHIFDSEFYWISTCLWPQPLLFTAPLASRPFLSTYP